MRHFSVLAALSLLLTGSAAALNFNEPLLRERLLSDNPALQNQALAQLLFLTLDQKRQLVPGLVLALRTGPVPARKASVALALLGPAGEPAVEELVEAL